MKVQSKFEERLNAGSHAFGVLFGIIGLIGLLISNTHKTEYSTLSLVIYGISIIVLFTSSSLYHIISRASLKHKFRIFDHISIYLLIAGTYTPVVLISLLHSKGIFLFFTVWGIAVFGTILKLFYTGRFEWFSTFLYLVMGWLIVIDINVLKSVITSNGIFWLMAGGFFYTIGIVFYAIERIPYNHVVWHIFVLAGAISHFIMVYRYII